MSDKRTYIRRPKRQTRQGTTFTTLRKKLGFVHAAQTAIGSMQAAVARVGTAILGGDFTGNARGDQAIDIQVARALPGHVASGAGAVAFGNNNEASGEQSVAVGRDARAAGLQSFALGVGAEATADYAVAVGSGAYAGGTATLALGPGAVASADGATAIGLNATADTENQAVIACEHLYVQLPDTTQKAVLLDGDITIDLSGLVEKAGDTMTGTLTAPTLVSSGRVYIGGGPGAGCSLLNVNDTIYFRRTDDNPAQLAHIECNNLRVHATFQVDPGYAPAFASGIVVGDTILRGQYAIGLGDRSAELMNGAQWKYQGLRLGVLWQTPSDADFTQSKGLHYLKMGSGLSADFTQWRDASDNILSRISNGGYFMTRCTTEPADGDIAAGELALA